MIGKGAIFAGLDAFEIELPSSRFSRNGTLFGEVVPHAEAATIQEKFAAAAFVKSLTGSVSRLALDVLWDLPGGERDLGHIKELERQFGMKAGSINPNLFQDHKFKLGSLANPDPDIRKEAVRHVVKSVEIAAELGARDIAIWNSDTSNYLNAQSTRRPIEWTMEGLSVIHAALQPYQRLLVGYKPFDAACHHTGMTDWGMALALAQNAGPQATVLVDTGHRYQGQNIEQIVAWLLRVNMLGGCHFNASDDDHTFRSMHQFQIFRILCEICADQSGAASHVALAINQSCVPKAKIEVVVQAVMTAQDLCAKALLVDRERLVELQDAGYLIEAEELIRRAFWSDVRPLLQEWRASKGLPLNPVEALADSAAYSGKTHL